MSAKWPRLFTVFLAACVLGGRFAQGGRQLAFQLSTPCYKVVASHRPPSQRPQTILRWQKRVPGNGGSNRVYQAKSAASQAEDELGTTPNAVMLRRRPPKRDKLEEVQHYAAQRGGRVLNESSPIRATDRIQVECAAGHRWLTEVYSLERGRWCSQCYQLSLVDDKGLQRLQETAAEKGGWVLNQTFTGVNNYYMFECERGHQWLAKGADILGGGAGSPRRGSWCRECHHIDYRKPPKRTKAQQLERLRATAAGRNGMLLSDKYTRGNVKYLWRCEEGHEWWAEARNILRGRWCPECAKIIRLKTDGLKQLRNAAAARKGKLLNQTYTGVRGQYMWECEFGHRWLAVGGAITVMGEWCPQCADLAARDTEGLQKLQQAAAARGGRLLNETYTGLQSHYRFECKRGHLWSATAAMILHRGRWCRVCFEIRMSTVMIGVNRRKDGLQVLQEVAAERGGRLISEEYLGMAQKHAWECQFGHTWSARAGNVLYGERWCPRCAREARKREPSLIKQFHRARLRQPRRGSDSGTPSS